MPERSEAELKAEIAALEEQLKGLNQEAAERQEALDSARSAKSAPPDDDEDDSEEAPETTAAASKKKSRRGGKKKKKKVEARGAGVLAYEDCGRFREAYAEARAATTFIKTYGRAWKARSASSSCSAAKIPSTTTTRRRGGEGRNAHFVAGGAEAVVHWTFAIDLLKTWDAPVDAKLYSNRAAANLALKKHATLELVKASAAQRGACTSNGERAQEAYRAFVKCAECDSVPANKRAEAATLSCSAAKEAKMRPVDTMGPACIWKPISPAATCSRAPRAEAAPRALRVDDVEGLKTLELKRELDARKLESTGLRSALASRLKAAVLAEGRGDDAPPEKKKTGTGDGRFVIRDFQTDVDGDRVAFGHACVWRVDRAEHGSVEYNLSCGRVVGAKIEGGEVFCAAPPLTRGESYEHTFDDVGTYVVTDPAYGLECTVEVYAVTGMKELREKVAREKRVRANEAAAAEERKADAARAEAERLRRLEERQLEEADRAAEAEAERERNDPRLRAEAEAAHERPRPEAPATVSGCHAEMVVHDTTFAPAKARTAPGVEFAVVIDADELGYVEYQFRCDRVLDGAPATRTLAFETDIMCAGDVFTHIFQDEGRYEIYDVDAEDAPGHIRVSSAEDD
ncbi:hypothetical protein JL720_3690 [Aureococcus anophagefferens]|nr:hypothetical protein JL720_3690 [Aureococcus anophagefferens]